MAEGVHSWRALEKRRDWRNETLMEIRIYFEGKANLRSGFEAFFSELTTVGRKVGSDVRYIPAKNGLSDYRKATRTHPNAWNLLLKDSEQAMPETSQDIYERQGIDPDYVTRVFWMVELMEAWFLADPDALAAYYGYGFSHNAAGNTADVERIPKSEVQRRLKVATRKTSKGEYDKV